MSLQLNDPGSYKYEEFYGPNNRQMPLLISGMDEGGSVVDVPRVPLSFAGVMKRKVEVLEMLLSAAKGIKCEHFSDLAKNTKTAPFYELLVAWYDNYFDTDDGAVRHSNGGMNVAPAAQYPTDLTPETKLVYGAVSLTNQDYAGLAGVRLNKADVDKYCGKPLRISDVKKNLVWLALAGGDKALLGAFADANAAHVKERFGYEGPMMGVYAPPVPNEVAAGSLWSAGMLYASIDNSRANGYYRLVNLSGRLVGVAPEAQRAATTPTLG